MREHGLRHRGVRRLLRGGLCVWHLVRAPAAGSLLVLPSAASAAFLPRVDLALPGPAARSDVADWGRGVLPARMVPGRRPRRVRRGRGRQRRRARFWEVLARILDCLRPWLGRLVRRGAHPDRACAAPRDLLLRLTASATHESIAGTSSRRLARTLHALDVLLPKVVWALSRACGTSSLSSTAEELDPDRFGRRSCRSCRGSSRRGADSRRGLVDRVFDSALHISGVESSRRFTATPSDLLRLLGYTDIAIGCSALFGFDLGPNFNFPYRAQALGLLAPGNLRSCDDDVLVASAGARPSTRALVDQRSRGRETRSPPPRAPGRGKGKLSSARGRTRGGRSSRWRCPCSPRKSK